MEEIVSIYITTKDAAEAERIGRALVTERLAACANVLPGVRSIYAWEGRVEEGDEVAVILKTRAARLAEVEARVRELHSYATPCLVVWPIVGGAADYRDWVLRETS